MYRLGIDIGGTFADGALVARESGRVWRAKRLATPDRPSRAIGGVVDDLLAAAGALPGDVEWVVHGSTIVANTLIERKGARTALVATAGFADVLELGADTRYDIYDLAIEFPEPLVPRARRLEVEERTAPDGSVEREPDAAALVRIAEELRAAGVESVAVSFLHAYLDGANERRARDALAAAGLDVSIGSEVAPEIREYDRTSTVVANAYVRPIVREYLAELAAALAELGITAPLLVMLSNGGVTSARAAAATPVRLAESGPAAGVLAAEYSGARSGVTRQIAFDVGGTTAKICFCDPRPAFTERLEVARVRRHLPGSGLPLLVPSVELVEIGAGGGSIARLAPGARLQVGPESAGAEPGPICYGRGGEEPTVTDADLVLGYLAGDGFLGGAMPLDEEAARRGLARLGSELGLAGALAAAAGVRRVVDEDMAAAVRLHAAERGVDVTEYSLFAFGGAGPVHAYEVARLLHLPRIVCPAGAGTGSALGLLVAPLAVDVARSLPARLDGLDWRRVVELDEEMRAQALGLLDSPAPEECAVERSVDVRYEGQGFEVTVPLDEATWASADTDAVAAAYERAYAARYRSQPSYRPAEAVTWRLRVTRRTPTLELVRSEDRSGPAGTRSRRAFFPELGELVETPVLGRDALPVGATLAGPLIVEEVDSTLVVGPSGRCRLDERGTIVVELGRSAP